MHDTPEINRLALAQQEMQSRRARAYAEPTTGSDPLLAKALRLQAMGRQAEAEQAQKEAVDRFRQIQRDYPMPPEAAAEERKPRTALTMRQARLYLQRAGLLGQVDTLVGELDEAAQIEWQYATIVEMSSPIVIALAAALELSQQEMQEMFDAAAEL